MLRILKPPAPLTSFSRGVRPVDILLVEDNPGDARLIAETLAEAKVRNRLTTVSDGEEALAFLRREEGFSAADRPDLILLDLNLPRKDGREVLTEIKADPVLAKIAVAILTGSTAEEDVLRAYNLNVNCYLTKPLDLTQFLHIVRSVNEFWLTLVREPVKE